MTEPMVPFAAYHELVKELASLKREGFVPSGPSEQPATMPLLPQVVQKAITDLGVDRITERQLMLTAWDMVRAGMPEDEIATRITDGEPAEL